MHTNCVIKSIRRAKNPKKNRVTVRYRDERLGSKIKRIQEKKVALASLYIERMPCNDAEKKAQMEQEEKDAAPAEDEAVGGAEIQKGEDDKDKPAVSL